MMLDVKHTWDALVYDFVKTPEARRRILQNPFYRLTQQFAGAEAYAALKQLDELHRAEQFDIQIVDTPPAAHAFEFFEAPHNLVKLLDSSAARWLFTPTGSFGRNALTMANRATRFVIAQLEAFTGTNTLSAIAEFFNLAADAIAELSERFHEVEAMMHSVDVSFVLVTTPNEDRLREALELTMMTQRHGFNLAAVVINRMLDERTFAALEIVHHRSPSHLSEISKLRRLLREPEPGLEALIDYLEEYREHQLREVELGLRFADQLPPDVGLFLCPEIEPGVRDLRSLAMLSSILTGPISGREFLRNAADTLGIARAFDRRSVRHSAR
jgi:anion-transporting  ArsA/GET3 family ATPase